MVLCLKWHGRKNQSRAMWQTNFLTERVGKKKKKEEEPLHGGGGLKCCVEPSYTENAGSVGKEN